MIKRLGLALVLASTVANAAPLFSANLLALTHIKSTYDCGNVGDSCGPLRPSCCAGYTCRDTGLEGECYY